jgi:hypothetical protein
VKLPEVAAPGAAAAAPLSARQPAVGEGGDQRRMGAAVARSGAARGGEAPADCSSSFPFFCFFPFLVFFAFLMEEREREKMMVDRGQME